MRRWVISMLVGATALALPGAASAEMVAIGNPLDQSQNFALGACPAGCTAVQLTQTAATPPLTSPVNGTIILWSVRSVQVGATYRLRILRPTGGLSYTFSGTSAISPAVPDVMDVARLYTASVPIQQGDRIGLESVSGPGVPLHTGAPATAADTYAYFPTAAGDGSTQLFTADPMSAREVLLRALIRYCSVPGVVGQAEFAAVTAVTRGDCTSTVTKQELRLKRVRKTFSKKKKAAIRVENARLRAQAGTVLSQSIAPGTTQGVPGPAVALTVGDVVAAPKPKKKKKKK